VSAPVALVAENGDRILASDPSDIRRLVAAAGTRAVTIAC